MEVDEKEYEALIIKCEELVKQVDEKHADIMTMRRATMKLCTVFNLTTEDGNDIKPEIRNKSVSPIKMMMKKAGNLMRLIIQSSVDSGAERELNEQFAFLDEVDPILEKYAGQ